ncbi:MAG: FAD-binding oxidoreductase [Rhodocyclaceae bacterium]|mgnify:CR=1 FL=1|nr:FAD-binding oxidoreductase [Rhodocyclaceae bacterium]
MLKLIHKTMQWFFMRVEGIFNIAFGDKLNPLYHLGTITFWQFWLVSVSGLYLFVFADTGVQDAYASVEAITHDQWWAGGIMRSVHRYASDGMIVTMMLHMARHFAFDKYRGFRWFSWITGVILIWLVYITGINGFMLVWDKLAQFVTVASAELLDWIPIFGGALIRNFIFEGRVNDRLFTLLAFIHLGAPLVVLMVMWIHVQRVPRAHINPPKAIAIWVTLTFVVLSLVRPVVSQDPANLSVEVVELDLDWFYLPVYPLIYDWPLARLWALLIGATAFLYLLPWLPPKLRGSHKAQLDISVHPDNRTVHARFGETILDAGLRGEINLPYECRNGGCGMCKCAVLNGEVDPGIYQPGILSAEERAQGKVLMCCATPLTDIEIEYEPQVALARPPVREYVGAVAKMEKLTHDVMGVTLQLPHGEKIPFAAGQYINILLEDGERRAFSFASAPHDAQNIELQIRLVPGGRFTTHVFEKMQVGDPIRFEGPLGDFVLRESSRPIIFVAGATGFAPVKSMVEDAFHRGLKRPIRLYWGVRQLRDLYLQHLPEQWQREHENFKFIPVLSEPAPDDAWTGQTGLVHEAILRDFPSLAGNEIYACGSVRMVEAIFPKLKGQGAEEGMCFSDAFTISARSMAIQAPAEGPTA